MSGCRSCLKKVKTLKIQKKGVKIGSKTVYNTEALFSRLLVFGKMWNISLESLFVYNLRGVPPAILDELASSTKATSRIMSGNSPSHASQGNQM